MKTRILIQRIICAIAIFNFQFSILNSIHAQKTVFLPDTMRLYDLRDDNSPWSWRRSLQTENLIMFWEKGFGYDLSSPPELEGKPMAVNTQNLYERLESFYSYFRDSLKFTQAGSKAERYKMMVMLNYSLDGTAYGGTYDDFIGALWVAPNRIQDRKMNCMAHELGHSFQMQIMADSVGECWGGTGFFEMTSQWMLWRVNPDWLTDENYHFEAFKNLTHKAYLDGENIYHSPYVLQYWAQKHGITSIADLYRAGKRGEDPVITYKRLYGVTQQEFNLEMIDCYQHLVNLDLGHAWNETRRYACTFDTQLTGKSGAWQEPEQGHSLEDYGFHAIRITPDSKHDITAEVKGSNLLYAFTYVNAEGKTVCTKPVSKGKIKFLTSSLEPTGRCLYLVIMGAPTTHEMLRWDNEKPNRQYPYKVRIY